MVIKHLFPVRSLFEFSCTCLRFHRPRCDLASSFCVFEVSLGVFESLPACWFILIPHSGFRDTLENMCIVCNINLKCFEMKKPPSELYEGGVLVSNDIFVLRKWKEGKWQICSNSVGWSLWEKHISAATTSPACLDHPTRITRQWESCQIFPESFDGSSSTIPGFVDNYIKAPLLLNSCPGIFVLLLLRPPFELVALVHIQLFINHPPTVTLIFQVDVSGEVTTQDLSGLISQTEYDVAVTPVYTEGSGTPMLGNAITGQFLALQLLFYLLKQNFDDVSFLLLNWTLSVCD